MPGLLVLEHITDRSAPSSPVEKFQYGGRKPRQAMGLSTVIQSIYVAFSQLDTSRDITKALYKVRRHQWQYWDIHYVVAAIAFGYAYYIIESPGIMAKTIIMVLLVISLLVPVLSQFFLPALPILSWLVLFYSCGSVPVSMRPPIQVLFLPAIETIFYGDDLSNILSSYTHPVLDILAWIPYGLVHFVLPFVTAFLVFIVAPPTSLHAFSFSFGYMNLIGVLCQLWMPCAPPWYRYHYGLLPANYTISGSAGGLARVDRLLGHDMYSTSFGASPMVFGALPSLHSGCAVMISLHLDRLFPNLRILWTLYVLWIWWSTMYLTHHYFIDLVCGGILAYLVFHLVTFKHSKHFGDTLPLPVAESVFNYK